MREAVKLSDARRESDSESLFAESQPFKRGWFVAALWRRISRFGRDFVNAPLLTLSGVNKAVLSSTKRIDVAYFTGLGGSVLVTAILAGVSSTFGLAIALGASPWSVVPLGILWALAVLNLDRWIVSGNDGGYIHRGSWIRVFVAYPVHVLQTTLKHAPRFALSVLLGVLFSEPLLTRIFEREIGEQLHITATLSAESDAARKAILAEAEARSNFEQAQEDLNSALLDRQADWDEGLKAINKELDAANTQVEDVTDAIETAKSMNADAAAESVASLRENAYFGTENIEPLGCRDRCLELLADADKKQGEKQTELDKATDDLYQPQLDSALEAQSQAQAKLNAYGPRPTSTGEDAVYTPPARVISPTNVPSADVLLEESGLLERIKALNKAGDEIVVSFGECPQGTSLETSGAQAAAPTADENQTVDESAEASLSCRKEDGAIGVAVWVIRLSLIAIDALPVLLKWLTSLFPALPYYRKIAAMDQEEKEIRQSEVERSRLTKDADIERTRWLSKVREDLLRTRIESYERSLTGMRVELGLQEVQAVQGVIRQDRKRVRLAADSPDGPARTTKQPDHPLRAQGRVVGPSGVDPTGDGLSTAGPGLFD